MDKDPMDTLTYSKHSTKRMQGRGISRRMVEISLEYGERRWSHGSTCCTLTDRALQGTPHAGQIDRLRGLCVVISGDHRVITAKWDLRLRRRPGLLRGARARVMKAARGREIREESDRSGQTRRHERLSDGVSNGVTFR